jgi:hypothetical protein
VNSELWVRSIGQDLNVFSAIEVFEVDGVRYDPEHRSNVARLMIQDIGEGHDCFPNPERCSFAAGSDVNDTSGAFRSARAKAYRWRPEMVYYRATQFNTPIYGS